MRAALLLFAPVLAAAAQAGAAGPGAIIPSDAVIQNAGKIGRVINSSGGYRFDGSNDCYGFVRRTWDPILSSHKLPPLPVSDYKSANWARISDWKALKSGDVLATHQGHMWGPNWHGGMFSGMNGSVPVILDNTPGRGVSSHANEMFSYYYLPTHLLLGGAAARVGDIPPPVNGARPSSGAVTRPGGGYFRPDGSRAGGAPALQPVKSPYGFIIGGSSGQVEPKAVIVQPLAQPGGNRQASQPDNDQQAPREQQEVCSGETGGAQE